MYSECRAVFLPVGVSQRHLVKELVYSSLQGSREWFERVKERGRERGREGERELWVSLDVHHHVEKLHFVATVIMRILNGYF